MAKATNHFLIKSEPDVFSYARLVSDGRATWDGVRNFTARNHLREMKKGNLLLFYHSNEGKAVVGIARVTREAYPDPTTKDDWSAVDIEPVEALPRAVTLAELREQPELATMAMLRLSRLSVSPVTAAEYRVILDLARKKPDEAPAKAPPKAPKKASRKA